MNEPAISPGLAGRPPAPRGEAAATRVAWIPGAGVAAFCLGLNLQMTNVADVLTGSSIMTGFLFGFVLFAFQLRLRVTDDAHIPNFGALRGLINRSFNRSIEAVLVSLGTTVIAVCADNFQHPGAIVGAPSHVDRYWTAGIAFLGLRLVALVVMAVYDLYRAYLQTPG